MRVWAQKFRNGSDRFLAIGTKQGMMAVWREQAGYLKATEITFPGCFRFMPYAETEEMRRRELAFIASEYRNGIPLLLPPQPDFDIVSDIRAEIRALRMRK